MSTSDLRENGYQGDVENADNHQEEREFFHSSTGLCPLCGCEIDTRLVSIWNDCQEIEQVCTCCDWWSNPYLDC